jgi:nucleotide-binding universal stress UspA family protein
MCYKTIAVYVTDDAHAGARYAFACQLAQADQSHLIGLASSGVTRFLRETVATHSVAPSIAPLLDSLRQRCTQALDAFEQVVAGFTLSGSERRAVDDDPRLSLGMLARYCDLCVLAQADATESGMLPAAGLAADVAKSSGAPVLLVPRAQAPAWPIRRILLGWNGSREAARAMRCALPLPQRASAVDVAIFDVEALQADGGPDLRPVTAVGQALARHGVRAELLLRDQHDGDAGAALLALAAERGADLLVMGCYGHARLRELLLGGATRSVLKSMTLPVLMAA